MTSLAAAVDALAARFSENEHHGEIVAAKAEFIARSGEVFEDDELYESRTAAFLEWYVIERPMAATGVPPIAVAARDGDQRHQALAASHRSLFAIVDTQPVVVLEDLLGGCLFHVDERRRLHGVDAGDLLEARLIPWEGGLVFGRGLLYHPAAARAAILEHARQVQAQGGSRLDAVDAVAGLRIRAERYKHVAPESVYSLPGRAP